MKQLEHFYDQDPDNTVNCPINYTLDVVRRKWVVPILCALNQNSVMRFTELKNAISGITNPVLSSVLKSLESAGLVHREQYNETPPRAEYSLTDPGRGVLPYLFGLAQWGLSLLEREGSQYTCSEKCYINRHLFLDPAKAAALSVYPGVWDEQYLRVWEELCSPACASLSASEKLCRFLVRMLAILTEGDIEFNRLLLVYMYGLGNAQLLNTSRPHYAIMDKLISLAKDEGSITKEKSNAQLTELLLKVIAGMECEWVLNGGVYDVIESNKESIAWLVERLRS